MPLPAFPGLDCECGEGPASSPCRGDGAKVEDMSSLAFLLSSSTVRLLSSRQQPTRWGRRIPPPLQMRRPKAARDEGGPPSRHGATESKPTSPRHSGHRTPAWSQEAGTQRSGAREDRSGSGLNGWINHSRHQQRRM